MPHSIPLACVAENLRIYTSAELRHSPKAHNWMDKSLDGRLLGRKELHVLLRAHHTEHMSHNILDPEHLRMVCNVKWKLLNNPLYPKVCALKGKSTNVSLPPDNGGALFACTD